MNRPLLSIFLCLCLAYPITNQAGEPATNTLTLSVGVLAIRGDAATRTSWQPTIDYLNRQLDGITLILQPLDLAEIDLAISNQSVAFLLTNPGNYVQMEMKHSISRIVSRLPRHHGSPDAVIGSTIFTRNDRDDINSLTDLRGQSLMGVSTSAFGGFQIAWHEMTEQGVNPFRDMAQLKFAGFPLDNIVYAVLNKQVDAGVVKSCLLEQMAMEGKISLAQIKIVSQKAVSNFTCQTSSQLYPDWPLAKLRQTPNNIAKAVTVALLSLPADSDAAKASKTNGWTIPVSYQSVHNVMQDLHIGAYGNHHHDDLLSLWKQYWQWVIIPILCFFAIVLHSLIVNRLVRLRTRQLTAANDRLQQEMQERQIANNKAKRHQAALAHLQRVSTLGELASTLAHEINQPLTAITSYAQGCVWRLESGQPMDNFLEVSRLIAQQASRAANVIDRIRSFVRKDNIHPKAKAIDINQLINHALELFYGQEKQSVARIELILTADLPEVWAEVVPVQQVLINLISNGLDSMIHLPMQQRQLQISTRRQSEQMVEIRVRDFGQGLTDENERRLFEAFYTTKSHGMGLGLSISQHLVEEQGGQLTLLKNSPEGVIMAFSLPIYQGQQNDD